MNFIARIPRVTPSPELNRLEDRFNRLLRDAFGPVSWPNAEEVTPWTPPVDILEEPTTIRIVAEVPGIAPKDVTIAVENNVLTMSGTKQQTAEEATDKVRRYERTYGAFSRSFTLPTSVDADGITATYENGLLTVRLPKAEKARPRQIQVEVAAK